MYKEGGKDLGVQLEAGFSHTKNPKKVNCTKIRSQESTLVIVFFFETITKKTRRRAYFSECNVNVPLI